MNIYNYLSGLPFLKKYSHKFLFIAFLGIHVPLIGIILYIVLGKQEVLSPSSVILIILGLTLLATGVTLFLLDQLLVPLIESKKALKAYIKNKTLPNLPVTYKDEAGILMQKVQSTIISLDELMRAKEDLFSLVSHDLRSPLNRIIGITDIMKEECTNNEIATYIEMISVESQRQLELLSSILQQLKYEQLEINEDKKEVVSLSQLVQTIKNTLQTALDQKNLELQVDIPETLKVRVDRQLFSQVLQNLLHNSCKFSFPDSTIQIKVEQNDKEVKILVKDRGIGFEEGDAEKYFQRFTKYGKQGTSGEKSTGIGLYLSRRIVERHAGTLNGYSDGPNTGAKYVVSLPQ